MFSRKHLITALAATSALALGMTGTAMAAASQGSAYVTGGESHASGYYNKGVHDWGTVYDTSPDGACVYAQVKLALNNYNDYQWTEARACGNGTHASWSKYHWGPILSAFSFSAVQGEYVRTCRVRNNLPDTCGGWAYIGR